VLIDLFKLKMELGYDEAVGNGVEELDKCFLQDHFDRLLGFWSPVPRLHP
jgi:hypothetical protein